MDGVYGGVATSFKVTLEQKSRSQGRCCTKPSPELDAAVWAARNLSPASHPDMPKHSQNRKMNMALLLLVLAAALFVAKAISQQIVIEPTNGLRTGWAELRRRGKGQSAGGEIIQAGGEKLAHSTIQVQVDESAITLRGLVGGGKQRLEAQRLAQIYAWDRKLVGRIEVGAGRLPSHRSRSPKQSVLRRAVPARGARDGSVRPPAAAGTLLPSGRHRSRRGCHRRR